ncbi:MAG: PQQ-binding-like beta-propeller repeat protein [Tannerellaceae bacterium]|nr:PQQ-binding-like beta-propeller repeat protein [Tannerellaceae bacterium]
MKQFILFIIGVAFIGMCGCRDIPLSSGTGVGEHWYLFRSDAAFSGYTKKQLPDQPALKWSYMSDRLTLSSPVIFNAVVYWPDQSGVIRGIDPDGKLSFEYDLATTVESTPMIYDSILYVGRKDGLITALSVNQKKIVWNFRTFGQIQASPNLVEWEGQKLVVIGSYDHTLYFIDTQTGREVNRFEGESFIQGAAALWNEYVLFGDGSSRLQIVDSRTGQAEDSFLLESAIPAAPAVRGHYCYLGDNLGNLYKFHMEKGKIIRHMKILQASDKRNTFISVPVVSSELLIFYSDSEHLYAVSRKDGSNPWKYKVKGKAAESAPVICGDKVLFCTRNGVVTILDAHKGKVLWEYDTGEEIQASPAVIEGHFYILTTQGTLFCFGEEN